MASRAHIHVPRHLGEQISDGVTAVVGSWWFIIGHAGWFVVWIALPVEPFPFGLLTMIVSLEAIFLSTLVMISQNRQAAKDHARDDLEAEEVTSLFGMNKRQLEILEILHELREKERA